MVKKAVDIHETFAHNLAFEDQIVWDAYSPSQLPLFKAKLNQLFRDPETTDLVEYVPTSNENDKSIPAPAPAPKGEKNKAMEKIREAIYKSTISQTKYTNKNLVATYILVTVSEGKTYLQARDANKFSVHLIVRTRKCTKNDDSTGCCMIFIDENGRVYSSWKHFMETNLLPKGIALAPSNGVYEFKDENLILDSWETPANGMASKIAGTADVAAGVSGFAAAGLTLAGLAIPFSAPIVAGAGLVCAASGVYSTIRSGWQLWNRREHEESINIADPQARGCWLGVASGALAISSTVATKSLAQVALAGKEVSLIHETVVNGMNISTMLLSGTGVANGIIDLLLKYNDEEKISALDVLQVAASLAIFTHSVYNFRLASTIVAQTQDARVSAYRSELSNRQRKMFDKMHKETIRSQGATKGKVDLIRLINEVPDNQYLNDMNKINKELNKKNVRFTAGSDGNILLNDEVPVKPSTLRDSVQHGKGENVLGKVTKPIPQSHKTIPNAESVNLLSSNAFSENSNTLINYCQSVLKVTSGLILNKDTFQNCVQNLITQIGEELTKFLIHMANDFLQAFRDRVETWIKTKLYFETVLWDLYQLLDKEIVCFTLTALEDGKTIFIALLLSHYQEMSLTNSHAETLKCDICGGTYQICPI